MQKFSTVLAASCLSLTVSLPALAQDADTVLATVNGSPITLGHMVFLQERLPEQYRNMPDDMLFQGLLNQMIDQATLSQEIEKESTKLLELGLENEIRAFLADEMLQRIAGEPISEDQLRGLYSEQYTEGEPGVEFNASHILVPTEAEAVALRAMIDDGSDFAELAREHSTGPSGPGGGALGWFGLGQMVPAFEETVVELEDGQISDPVQTQFGWHIVKRNESRVQSAPDFETVRDQLERDLRQRRVTTRVSQLRSEAEVVIEPLPDLDPSLIRQTDLLE